MPPRLLVLDAYAPEGRAAVRGAGGTEAGALYRRMLEGLAPGARVDVAYPADPSPELPSAAELSAYDGVVWTGSSLTIHESDDPRVSAQVGFARRVFDVGVPSFGSCWAAQLAVVAAGGRCAASPRGREFGISRQIALEASGREHPLYAGKPATFDAFTSHADEIAELPSGATRLAGNAWSHVQAVDVRHGAGRFWAVQYHPEYDLHEVACLCRLRRDELVAQGTFASAEEADRWIEAAEALHADPSQRPPGLELDASLAEAGRTIEVRNWLDSLGSDA